ncbi:LysR family transcriptional regulator [Streptacidiphilus sp. PB12-B1b]|uniref:LysR family transcriptional regulator n=1 Tax=Streptacidiphilus sp. PB12-B1b TaxID=2705012 RepID=UPI0015FE1137|nr:LysR family transcriptional regulator [Streptacidiphilus sp. PB12-B1b]QMU79781.1 LysR family transcriptional regulator [Streptacidiphilus sp. PB12-B1b]
MQLDLNLLTALDALLEEGSVAGAADRLHLTPPAMSRALGRIRHVMGDEVLVRTGRTMTPTPRALAVRQQVHALVQQAQSVLAPEHEPDLPTLTRTFTLTWHDAVVNAIGPALLATVRSQAPQVRLRLLGETSTDSSDLRQGRVDLEIGATAPELPDVHHETVTHDRLVVALRPDHPGAADGLTLDAYAAADHVTVSRRGRLRDPIDDLLEERGLRRRVVAAVPTSTAALHVARDSDILVAVPEQMTRAAVRELGLRVLPLPLDAAPIPVVLAWHRRYADDRAHAWLRTQVRAALQSLDTPD